MLFQLSSSSLKDTEVSIQMRKQLEILHVCFPVPQLRWRKSRAVLPGSALLTGHSEVGEQLLQTGAHGCDGREHCCLQAPSSTYTSILVRKMISIFKSLLQFLNFICCLYSPSQITKSVTSRKRGGWTEWRSEAEARGQTFQLVWCCKPFVQLCL